MTSFHASAPVRLDFAGGWTDVAPFATRERGRVCNAAIDLRVTATVQPGGALYRLVAEDLAERQETPDLAPDGRLPLHKAALRRSGIGACELSTRSAAPAGSGLGSSGALGVALVGALDLARGVVRAAAETAEEAWRVEALDADLAGGRQDQYAAALGGFNTLTFFAGGEVAITPIELAPEFRATLAEHLLICYTGASRVSSRMIARVMDAYAAGDASITAALRDMADIALDMADALVKGDLHAVGALLDRNWKNQQALDPGMRTAEMAGLESAMRRAGAIGGKAAGAGAGGCMFFVCEDPARGREAAEAAGATVLPCVWAAEGVRTWRA